MNVLSDEERILISRVLERDVKLQKQEQQRLLVSKGDTIPNDNEIKDQNRDVQQKQVYEKRCCICIGHRICRTCQKDFKPCSGSGKKWFFKNYEKQKGSLLKLNTIEQGIMQSMQTLPTLNMADETPSSKFLDDLKRMSPRGSVPDMRETVENPRRASSTFAVDTFGNPTGYFRYRKISMPRSQSKDEPEEQQSPKRLYKRGSEASINVPGVPGRFIRRGSEAAINVPPRFVRRGSEQSINVPTKLFTRRSSEVEINPALLPKKDKIEELKKMGKQRKSSLGSMLNMSRSNPNLEMYEMSGM